MPTSTHFHPDRPSSGALPEKTTSGPNSISHKDYQFIRDLIYQESRINLGDNKKELVSARLGKRLRATGAKSISGYCDLLRTDQTGEIYQLIDAISTNHTFFFRENTHFEYMTNTVLPAFARGEIGQSQVPFRLWSCACSTGEEPYSLAILLHEYFANKHTWNIECSDISTKVLAFAQKGIYDAAKLKTVRADWIRKYFQKGFDQMEGYYRFRAELRTGVRYQRLNLFAAEYPFTEKFHVIFCRNVMIYFDRPTQEQLVNRLSQHLHPGGYLMIGHAESLAGIRHSLQSLKPAIYRKPR